MVVSRTRVAMLAIALAVGLPTARADEKRLSVVAKGAATQRADTVEIEFTVTARAETAADAEKNFRDRLAQVEEALREGEAKAPRPKRPAPKPQPPMDEDEDELPRKKPAKKKPVDEDEEDEAPPRKKPAEEKPAEEKPAEKKTQKSEDLASVPIAITQRGFTIGVKGQKGDDNPMAKIMARQMGGGPEKTESPMAAGCKVVVTIKDAGKLDRTLLARRIAGLIDVAIEAGADGAEGDAPVVNFLVNPEALRAAAYRDAVEKAKGRATELATAAGLALGGVAGIQEAPALVGVRGEDAQGIQEKMVGAMFGVKSTPGGALPTMDVNIEVELRVEFELQKVQK